MSIFPSFFNDVLDELQRPSIFDQHFGLGVPDSDLLSLPLQQRYYRPFSRYLEPRESGMSRVIKDKEGLKVNLDVQQFRPEELNVKVVNDFIVIEGKHEERYDEHGFVSRQFTRRYKLPNDVDANALESKLSSDGVLQLHAPKLANGNERSITITRTNQPALKRDSAAKPEAVEEGKKKKPAK